MAKRFTDTNKWSDPWFRKLTVHQKLFWLLILDLCDETGVWKVDLEMAEFYIKKSFTIEEIMKFINNGKERIRINGEKMLILTFAEFQYGSFRNSTHPFHRKLVSIIENGYPIAGVYHTPQDKDKDKDKEGVVRGNHFRPEHDECVQKWNDFANKHRLAEVRGLSDKRVINLTKRMKSELFSNFDSLLMAIEEQPFLLGENDRKWKIHFDWLIHDDTNHMKVLERKYKTDTKPTNEADKWKTPALR